MVSSQRALLWAVFSLGFGAVFYMMSPTIDLHQYANTLRDKYSAELNITNLSPEYCPEIQNKEELFYALDPRCADRYRRRVGSVTTVLLNGAVPGLNVHSDAISRMVKQLDSLYPGISVKLALSKSLPDTARLPNLKVVRVKRTSGSGAIWNKLVAHSSTKLVLVARDVVWLDEEINLDRLVRSLMMSNAGLVGGAIKAAHTGNWHLGCRLTAFRNYTLRYRNGYRHSAHDCLYCQSVQGPFLATAALMRKHKLDEKLPPQVLFEDLFWRLFNENSAMLLCPDSMYNVREGVTEAVSRQLWLPFAQKWGIHVLVTSDGEHHRFTCKEMGGVKKKTESGLSKPPCTMLALSEFIKFTMRTLAKHNVSCFIAYGTTVGGVKLGSILPWEDDADVGCMLEDMGVIKPYLDNEFKKAGYTYKYYPREKHIVGQTGGYSVYDPSQWRMDLFGWDSRLIPSLQHHGRKPTRVNVDGMWMNTYQNPGLRIRGLYGPEIYRHVEHRHVLSDNDNPDVYVNNVGTFGSCPVEGRHDCMDQYSADGNIQFGNPVP